MNLSMLVSIGGARVDLFQTKQLYLVGEYFDITFNIINAQTMHDNY